MSVAAENTANSVTSQIPHSTSPARTGSVRGWRRRASRPATSASTAAASSQAVSRPSSPDSSRCQDGGGAMAMPSRMVWFTSWSGVAWSSLPNPL